MNKSSVGLMENEPVKSALIKLSTPAIIGMLITSAYNIADTLFIGAMDITSATAAVSIAFPLFLLIGAVGLAFGIGGGTYVSRLLGAKRTDETKVVYSSTIFSVILLSILVTALGLLFLKPLLKLLGASETIMPYAVSYSKIIICGSLLTISNMAMDNLIRFEGNPKFSMSVTLIGSILNIILDPIFIFVFGLGLEGAAYATILGQLISFLLFAKYYAARRGFIPVSLRCFIPSLNLYKEILSVGIPVFLKQFLICFSAGLVNIAAAHYGDFAVAAMGITMRVTSLGIMIIIGFTLGLQPLAAFSYGARRVERLHEAIKTSIIWLTGFTVVYALLLAFFAKYIVLLFSRDVYVVNAGVSLFRAFCLTFPFLGIIYIYSALVEALGIGIYALVLATARQGFLLIPCLLILPSYWGFTGIVYSQPIADILTAGLTAMTAVKLNKKLRETQGGTRGQVPCPTLRDAT